MKVWIQDELGYLKGYSIIPQETMIEVEADREPTDFTNWRYDGKKLIHDPENAPAVEESLTETEQLKKENEELRQREDMSDEALLELADMVLSATAAMKGGN